MTERFAITGVYVQDGNRYIIKCVSKEHAERIARMLNAGEGLAIAMGVLDTAKLLTLADYFDKEQSEGRWGGASGSREVQNDIRGGTHSIAAALAAWEEASQ